MVYCETLKTSHLITTRCKSKYLYHTAKIFYVNFKIFLRTFRYTIELGVMLDSYFRNEYSFPIVYEYMCKIRMYLYVNILLCNLI